MASRSRGASQQPHRQSRDHILPRARGGTDTLHGDVRNIATICQGTLRAALVVKLPDTIAVTARNVGHPAEDQR